MFAALTTSASVKLDVLMELGVARMTRRAIATIPACRGNRAAPPGPGSGPTACAGPGCRRRRRPREISALAHEHVESRHDVAGGITDR